MKQATLNDLIASDDPLYSECPIGFDYPAAITRVAALQLPLEALTGFQLLQDTCVQDASFFTELFARDPIPRSHPAAGLIVETFIAVRFSAFGDFFTIWGCSRERPISDNLRNQVSAFVCQHGFIYVPEELLELPHPKYGTWGIRYFDYI